MSHIYTVTIDGERNVAHVQAKSKAAAKKFALASVTVKKLGAVEVLALVNAGLAIVDAETGNIVNSAPAADDGIGFDPGP